MAVAVVGLAALPACTSLDDFTGENITKATSSGLSTILGVKRIDEQNEEIEIRARSPLVVPPNYALRPPETPEQEKAQLGANWPDDPDVKARELAALEAAREAQEEERIRKDGVGRSRAVTAEELNRSVRPEGYRPKVTLKNDQEATYAMKPDELLRRHRERAQAEEEAAAQQQAGEGNQGTQANQAGGTQQVQETATSAPPQPKKKKGFLDRLVFWD